MDGNPQFFIYIPGFPPKPGSLDQIVTSLLGNMPEYDLVLDRTINLVHKKYKIFTIRLTQRGTYPIIATFYVKKMAQQHFLKYVKQYPDYLIECATTDYNFNVLHYSWYKKLKSVVVRNVNKTII